MFDPGFQFTLTFVTERRGRAYREPLIGDGFLTAKTRPIEVLFQPTQRRNDLLQFSLGPLMLAQRHLLLLNCVHPGESADRLIKTHRLPVLRAGLQPLCQRQTHGTQLSPKNFLLLLGQGAHTSGWVISTG